MRSMGVVGVGLGALGSWGRDVDFGACIGGIRKDRERKLRLYFLSASKVYLNGSCRRF